MSKYQKILNDTSANIYWNLLLYEDFYNKIKVFSRNCDTSEFIVQFIKNESSTSNIEGMLISVPYEDDNVWELRNGNIPNVIKLTLIGKFNGTINKSIIIENETLGYNGNFFIGSKSELYSEIYRVYNYLTENKA
jgi:hypothetical protein